MLSVEMGRALCSDRRNLAWLFWFEGLSSDLYAWSGMHDLDHDGHVWKGVGHVLGMSTIDRGDALSFRTQSFQLRGLDPQVLAEIDESVRGRAGKVWLAALDEHNKVIRDPLLVAEVVQDTLEWKLEDGNTVTLEDQVLKMGQIQADYAALTGLYRKQMALMRSALGKGGSA